MSSPWLSAMLAGAGLALASSMHCLTMCGPLAAGAKARGGASASGSYLVGRLAAYGSLGLLAGSFGEGLAASPWARWVELVLAWALALILVHTALGYLGVRRSIPLLQIGRAPRYSLGGRVLARVAHDPLLLGAATALLPCSALYAAVLASAALGDGAAGALFMTSFALATSPVILTGSQLARLADLGRNGRRVFASVLLAGALVTALRPLSVLRAEPGPSCPLHAHHAEAN